MSSFIRFLAAGLIVSGTAAAVTPYAALRSVQLLFDDIYGVMPRLDAGVRFPQSNNFAFRAELAGTYGTGRGEFAPYRVWTAMLRAGEEANFSPVFDGHLVAGVMYVQAGERSPQVDSNGAIVDRWVSGSAMGLYSEAGVRLLQNRAFRVDFEVGLDIGAVQTFAERLHQGERYSAISITGLNAGFVFRLCEREPQRQNPSTRLPSTVQQQ